MIPCNDAFLVKVAEASSQLLSSLTDSVESEDSSSSLGEDILIIALTAFSIKYVFAIWKNNKIYILNALFELEALKITEINNSYDICIIQKNIKVPLFAIMLSR